MSTEMSPAGVRYLQVRQSVMSDIDMTALAGQLGGERNAQLFVTAATAAIEGDEKILACDPSSIVRALYTCAAMGALPSSSVTPQTQREAALIPRNKVLTVMPEWRYFKRQIERHPDVQEARAYLVHEFDTYDWDPDAERLTHTYDPFAKGRVFGPDGKGLAGGYLRIRYTEEAGGGYRDFPVTREHIASARKAGGPVWKEWPEEMATKTIYRKAASSEVLTFDPMSEVGRQIGAALRADVDAADADHRPRLSAVSGAKTPAAAVASFAKPAAPAHNPATGEVTAPEQWNPDDEELAEIQRRESEQSPLI